MRNNQMIAYSQKMKYPPSSGLQQQHSSVEQLQMQSSKEQITQLAGNDRNIVFVTDADRIVHIASNIEGIDNSSSETPFLQHIKAQQYLTNQAIQIHKQKVGHRNRFINFPAGSPLFHSGQLPSNYNLTHTFRSEAGIPSSSVHPSVAAAFPELSQGHLMHQNSSNIAQNVRIPIQSTTTPQNMQQAYFHHSVSAKLEQKNGPISVLARDKLSLFQSSIGEQSIEEEYTISHEKQATRAIAIKEMPINIIGDNHGLQKQKSSSKLASANKLKMKFIGQRQSNASQAVVENSTAGGGKMELKKAKKKGYESTTEGVLSGKPNGRQEGEMMSTISGGGKELKGRDFKEYLKVQLEEVQKTHMKSGQSKEDNYVSEPRTLESQLIASMQHPMQKLNANVIEKYKIEGNHKKQQGSQPTQFKDVLKQFNNYSQPTSHRDSVGAQAAKVVSLNNINKTQRNSNLGRKGADSTLSNRVNIEEKLVLQSIEKMSPPLKAPAGDMSENATRKSDFLGRDSLIKASPRRMIYNHTTVLSQSSAAAASNGNLPNIQSIQQTQMLPQRTRQKNSNQMLNMHSMPLDNDQIINSSRKISHGEGLIESSYTQINIGSSMQRYSTGPGSPSAAANINIQIGQPIGQKIREGDFNSSSKQPPGWTLNKSPPFKKNFRILEVAGTDGAAVLGREDGSPRPPLAPNTLNFSRHNSKLSKPSQQYN